MYEKVTSDEVADAESGTLAIAAWPGKIEFGNEIALRGEGLYRLSGTDRPRAEKIALQLRTMPSGYFHLWVNCARTGELFGK